MQLHNRSASALVSRLLNRLPLLRRRRLICALSLTSLACGNSGAEPAASDKPAAALSAAPAASAAAPDAPAASEAAAAGGAQAADDAPAAGNTEAVQPTEETRLLWPPEGKRVLIAGDSMVGGTAGLTRALQARFKEAGSGSIRSDSWVSANLSMFHQQKRFWDLLRKQRPDVVLITLGANDAFTIAPQSLAPHVRAIVKKLGDTPCAWISPPPFRSSTIKDSAARFDKFTEMLAENVAPCRFFDSRSLTTTGKDGAEITAIARARDGIHPTNDGGALWAEAVWQALFAPTE